MWVQRWAPWNRLCGWTGKPSVSKWARTRAVQMVAMSDVRVAVQWVHRLVESSADRKAEHLAGTWVVPMAEQ